MTPLLATEANASATLLPLGAHVGFMAAFVGTVFALLVADLALFHRNPRPVGWKAALAGVGFWVLLGLAFNATLYVLAERWLKADPAPLIEAGRITAEEAASDSLVALAATNAAFDLALQWLAGYVIEMSLSVDNLFVFVVVLRYFAIPAALQHRVLFWGILGAVVLRALFIGAGVAVLHQFDWVAGVFGVFLLVTGVKMIAPGGGDDLVDPSRTVGFRLLKFVLPLQREFDGNRFFSRVDQRLVATPLLGALVVIEFSDVVFAVDSVPAVLAITREPIIAFTSNIAAVLGLRAMYFLLANAVDRFHLLKPALGLVLAFVGLKMTWHWWYGAPLMPVVAALSIVLGTVLLGIVLSLAIPPRAKAEPPAA
ncbi:MAG: TerC/Alx family metal homeostasis membrane protein [Phycisphaerales bacterium]